MTITVTYAATTDPDIFDRITTTVEALPRAALLARRAQLEKAIAAQSATDAETSARHARELAAQADKDARFEAEKILLDGIL